jgi:hypothetical protein
MQTILLQDDPILFRGLEHSLLRRDGIHLLTASGEAALVAACSRSGADVVLLAAGSDKAELTVKMESLPHAPLCVSLPVDGEAGGVMARVRDHLGLSARQEERHPCRVPVRFQSGAGWSQRRTRDLSVSGVFIASEDTGSIESPVDLEFKTDGKSPTISCRGRVTRTVSAKEDSDHLAGLAVHFTSGHGLSRLQLEVLLAAARSGQR